MGVVDLVVVVGDCIPLDVVVPLAVAVVVVVLPVGDVPFPLLSNTLFLI